MNFAYMWCILFIILFIFLFLFIYLFVYLFIYLFFFFGGGSYKGGVVSKAGIKSKNK